MINQKKDFNRIMVDIIAKVYTLNDFNEDIKNAVESIYFVCGYLYQEDTS